MSSMRAAWLTLCPFEAAEAVEAAVMVAVVAAEDPAALETAPPRQAAVWLSWESAEEPPKLPEPNVWVSWLKPEGRR